VQWLPSLANRPLKLDDALFETGTPLASKQRMEAVLPASAVLKRYSTKADFEKDAISDGQLIDWLQRQLREEPLASALAHAQATSAQSDNVTPTGQQHVSPDTSLGSARLENRRSR
jgi:hypothetical protein